MMSATPDISIVIPTYKAGGGLVALIDALGDIIKTSRRSWEVILVDDGSPDGTWNLALELKEKADFPLRAIRLRNNVGQHNATIAGLREARGQCVVTMDDDLQHSPSAIEDLIAPLERGAELVLAAYPQKEHSSSRNFGGQLVDGLLRRLFGLPKSLQLTSFRAMTASVAKDAAQTQDPFPYLTARLLVSARSVVNVTLAHQPGTHRDSHYSLWKSIRLAARLVFGYSALPIYAIIALALFAALTAGLAIIWVVSGHMIDGGGAPGWASTIAMIAAFNGLNLIGLATLGVYIARIDRQLSGRSHLFVIEDIHD